MPRWRGSVVDQREEMCRLALSPGANRREVFACWGLSRSQGYVLLKRYLERGREGLRDLSRRPHNSPRRTAAEREAAVVALREANPAWGGRKLHRLLLDETGASPSPSTITAILRRHGRLDGPRSGQPRDHQRFEADEPNALWQMDFKGHFALTSGRCHPLTALDDHSRYAVVLAACGGENTVTVQTRLTEAFERYGLPGRILCDNGPPWGTAGSLHRHTPLTVWLMDLDVGVSHGRPLHPQTQGKEERFHRTLKAEVLAGRQLADLEQAQKVFDTWRSVYNTRRPHEALGMAVPASRYAISPRRMPKTVPPPEYESQAHVRMAREEGCINFKGRKLPCPKAFAGKPVALRATQTDGVFDLCYRRHRLAQVDLRQAIS
jgi:transposase InsO family protein